MDGGDSSPVRLPVRSQARDRDGFWNTRRDESKILLSVTGAMAEAYRDEISRRTRRGLEGRATNRAPTGGRAYGYIAAKDSGTGQVQVHAEQAAIVRRIFEHYAWTSLPGSRRWCRRHACT